MFGLLNKTKYLLLASFMVTAVAFSVGHETAAAPNYQINYQGKLTDATGLAVPNGTYNMRFWLITSDSAASTTAIWDEELVGSNKVQVTNGLFSVMLGSTSPLNSVDFSQTLYLGVEIGSTTTNAAWDGEMSPRKILGTVPAAFEAKQFDGLATTSFLRSDLADTASQLLTFSNGLISQASSTIASLTTVTATTTNLYVNDGGTVTLANLNNGGFLTTDANGVLSTSTVSLTTDISGTLAVANGGTGATSLTGFLFGNGTSAVTGSSTLSDAYISDALTLGSGATLANDLVTPDAVLSAGQTDGYCLTYSSGGDTWAWNVCAAGGTGSTLSNVNTYTSSTTWTKPAALDYIIVELWGAGGGGGGGGSNPGGGGGSYGGDTYFDEIATSTGGGGGGGGGGYFDGSDAADKTSEVIELIDAGGGGGGGYGNTYSRNGGDGGNSGSGLGGTGSTGSGATPGTGSGYGGAGGVQGGTGGIGGSGGGSGGVVSGSGGGGGGGGGSNGGNGGNGGSNGGNGGIGSGGGGGGGATSGFPGGGGGGGGAGGYNRYVFDASELASSTYRVIIGSGGAGATAGAGDGGRGGDGQVKIYEFTTLGTATGTIENGTQGQVAYYNATGNTIIGTSSIFINTNGDIGIGSTSPTGLLSVNGEIYLASTTPGQTTNSLYNLGGSLYFNGSAVGGGLWTQNGSDAYYNTGNIGIGTTSPSSKLSIHAKAGDTNRLLFSIASSTPTATSSHFVVTRDGDIGIGTASPESVLNVVLGASGDNFNLDTSGNFTNALRIKRQGTEYGALYNSGSSDDFVVRASNSGGDLILQAGGSNEYMRILSTGNIGIGSTTPNDQLTVSGDINIDANGVGYEIGGQTILTGSSTSALTLGGFGAGASLLATTTADAGNTIFGYQALNTATSARYTTALGYLALSAVSDISAIGNTAVGYESLYQNKTGYNNTAVGAYTLQGNTTGYLNTALGMHSLYSNQTGNQNVAVGDNALTSLLAGDVNVAIGSDSLYGARGSNNVGIGFAAGAGAYSSFTNQGSVAIGYLSGYSFQDNSDYNTLLGFNSGRGITAGANNLLLGASPNAASYNQVTTGDQNIAIGYDVALPSATANGQLNIQNIIYGTGNTGTGSTLSTGNIGIGSTSPSAKLSVFDGSSSGNDLFKVASSTSGTGTTSYFVIDQNGRVGIGGDSTAGAWGDPSALAINTTDDYSGTLSLFNWVNNSDGADLMFQKSRSDTLGAQTAVQNSDEIGYIGFGGSDGSSFQPAAAIGAYVDASVSGGTVPIALRFYTGTSGGGSEQMRIASDGNIGIGTTSPAARLSVKGSGTGTGDAFRVTNSSDTAYFTIQDNGNVGIGEGNVNPVTQLDIYRDNTNTGAQFTVQQDGTGDATMQFLLTASQSWTVGIDNSDNNKFKIGSANDGFGSTKLTIDTSGNIGIGSTSPNFKLTVAGDIFGAGLTATGSVTFRSLNNGGFLTTDANGVLSTTTVAASDLSLANGYVFRGDASGFAEATSSLFIADNGWVGIGTTTSNAMLEVSGTTRLGTDALTGDNQNDVILFSNAAGTAAQSGNYSNSLILYGGGSQTRALTLNQDYNGGAYVSSNFGNLNLRTTGNNADIVFTTNGTGKVGIGTSAPASLLDIWGDFRVGTSGTPTLFTDVSTGYVGIGTAAPGNPLQVVANGSGQVLRLEENSGGEYMQLEVNSSADLSFRADGGGARLTILQSSASVGISEFSPEANLEISADGVTSGAALMVSSVDDADGDIFSVLRNGNVGIGSSSPSSKLTVHAKAGETNTKLFEIASSTASATSSLFTVLNNGYVGIGTNSPTGQLMVTTPNVSNATSLVLNRSGSESSALTFRVNGGSGVGHYVGIGSTRAMTFYPTSAPFGIGDVGFGTDGSAPDVIFDSSTGQFGIGTTTPVGLLSVNGEIYLASTTPGQTANSLYNLGGSLYFNGSAVGGGASLWTESGSDIYYTGGNVGIGTTSPSTLFSVGGNTFLGGNVTATGTLDVTDVITQGVGTVDVAGYNNFFDSIAIDNANPTIRFRDGGADLIMDFDTGYFNISSENEADVFTIYDDGVGGYVGIGTTTPAAKLDVWGDFRVGTSSVPALFADVSLGRVGIGTSTPAKRLSVYEEVADAQFRISYDQTRYADFQIDSSGDMLITASGDDITFSDDNVWICEGGACPSITASSTAGYAVVENGVYFGNGMKIDQITGTTTQLGVYNASGSVIMIFDGL